VGLNLQTGFSWSDMLWCGLIGLFISLITIPITLWIRDETKDEVDIGLLHSQYAPPSPTDGVLNYQVRYDNDGTPIL